MRESVFSVKGFTIIIWRDPVVQPANDHPGYKITRGSSSARLYSQAESIIFFKL